MSADSLFPVVLFQSEDISGGHVGCGLEPGHPGNCWAPPHSPAFDCSGGLKLLHLRAGKYPSEFYIIRVCFLHAKCNQINVLFYIWK